MSIGCDWVGLTDHVETGLVKGYFQEPNLDDYDIIVLQQPYSPEGYEQIKDFHKHGQKVVYEIDDYSHGVPDPRSEHHLAEKWTKDRLYWTEKCMEVSDVVICSTERLAENYSKYNKTVVCKNGIDTGRYNLKVPERDTINIGWQGGHGATKAIKPMLKAVGELMNEYKNVNFVTVGHTEYGAAFQKRIPSRVIVIPFTFMEIYPAACMNIDIGIAPANDDPFFMCKSDLRFLEYGMMNIPGVYNPLIYLEVEHEKTGLLANGYKEYKEQLERYILDANLRKEVAANAKQYVLTNRTFPNAAIPWVEVFDQLML